MYLRLLAMAILFCTTLTLSAEPLSLDAGWQLPRRLCWTSECASFSPSDGTPAQTQSWRSSTRLDRPGLLTLPPGLTRIERPATGQVILAGPGLLLYQGRSSFSALQPLELQYTHEDQSPASLEILLPTLILGTEGTRFRILPIDAAQVQIGVEQGTIWYQQSDRPQVPRKALPQGQYLVASSLVTGRERRSAIPSNGLRQTRMGRRGIQASPLPLTLQALARQLEQEALHRTSPLSDDQLTVLASAVLPHWSDEERRQVAELLALRRPEDQAAGRVILQLWLQSSLEAPDGQAAQALEALLREHFAHTSWPGVLEGYRYVLAIPRLL